MVALHIHHPLWVMWPIGLVGRDSGGPGFTRSHPQDSLFEAGNEIPFTNGKLERFTLHRGIKGRTISKATSIVHPDQVAMLCLGHDDLLCRFEAKACTHRWEDGKSWGSHHGPSRAHVANVV